MTDTDIIERVKVMPLQPGDLVVFELVAGTSMSEAHEFMHQLETLARQRPEITFCAMHELEGVRIVRQAEIPAYVDPKMQHRLASLEDVTFELKGKLTGGDHG